MTQSCFSLLTSGGAARFLTRLDIFSLLVAAVFAVHPIHVESVAWVTERKDVLAVLFCLLAMLCHERRARSGEVRWLWLMVVVD